MKFCNYDFYNKFYNLYFVPFEDMKIKIANKKILKKKNK